MNIYHGLFHFRYGATRHDQSRKGICYIRAYQNKMGRDAKPIHTTIIVTELPHNRGRSVTNAIEEITSQFAWLFNLDIAHLSVYEHQVMAGLIPWRYARQKLLEGKDLGSYDFVIFAPDGKKLLTRFSEPTWRRVECSVIEDSIGEPLPPIPMEILDKIYEVEYD